VDDKNVFRDHLYSKTNAGVPDACTVKPALVTTCIFKDHLYSKTTVPKVAFNLH
jgi:hypothetical protein